MTFLQFLSVFTMAFFYKKAVWFFSEFAQEQGVRDPERSNQLFRASCPEQEHNKAT